MNAPRSGCPINLTLEALGNRWSLIVIRDLMFGNRRHFRELLTRSEERIVAIRIKSVTGDVLRYALILSIEPKWIAPRSELSRWLIGRSFWLLAIVVGYILAWVLLCFVVRGIVAITGILLLNPRDESYSSTFWRSKARECSTASTCGSLR